ncbi:MAG: hypothetical protein QNJ72_37315 [Pleurocapsa sp. MO_226.B13]|nr:hypothetical protein [Pleurocapsa sp. MO_226.B13]
MEIDQRSEQAPSSYGGVISDFNSSENPIRRLISSTRTGNVLQGPGRSDRRNQEPRKTESDYPNIRYRSFSNCHESLVN